MTYVQDPTAVCASCAQPITGRYCSQCGEEVFDPHRLTVGHFISHTLLHEMLHVDGTTWRTLRGLLLRPGFLSAEYCAGRRRLYVNPVRLLAVAIIVYAMATRGGLTVALQIGRINLNIAPTKAAEGLTIADTVRRLDRFGVLQSILDRKMQSADLTTDAARDAFHRKLETFAEPLSFTNVVLLALVLYAVFHRSRPLFVEHGVFSMHLLSFVLLSSLTLVAGTWMLRGRDQFLDSGMDAWTLAALATMVLVVVWQFVYLAIALRRFYLRRTRGPIAGGALAAAAALVIYVVNSTFITGVQLLGGAVALWAL